jgi:hypothetical protein
MSYAMRASKSEAGPAATARASAKAPTVDLRVGKPDDAFEQEADRAADEVMAGNRKSAAWSLSRMTVTPPLQRECSCGGECEECKKTPMLQRKAAGEAPRGFAPSVVHDALRSPARHLDPGTRTLMESRFGHDFGRVRVHTDDIATRSARAVAANAYTVGDNIVFDRGRYAPETDAGRRLLAHELAHVVQQQGAPKGVVQRDSNMELADDDTPVSNTVLSQALAAADRKQWEVAARLANGLSPGELKIFVQTLKDPELISQLHIGAVNGAGVGKDSAIAQFTEETHAAVKHDEEVRYARQLAKQNGTPPPPENGVPAANVPPPRKLTVQEKKEQCAKGEPPHLKVFPLRMPHGMWRISVAPISAHKEGDEILVKQPLNSVYADSTFRRETKTLPMATFLGSGLHLQPDEVVRVRLYDDNERLICVSGEEMLRLSDATDTALLISALGTVVDAATVMAPGASAGLSRGMNLAIGASTVLANEGLDTARQVSAVNYA